MEADRQEYIDFILEYNNNNEQQIKERMNSLDKQRLLHYAMLELFNNFSLTNLPNISAILTRLAKEKVQFDKRWALHLVIRFMRQLNDPNSTLTSQLDVHTGLWAFDLIATYVEAIAGDKLEMVLGNVDGEDEDDEAAMPRTLAMLVLVFCIIPKSRYRSATIYQARLAPVFLRYVALAKDNLETDVANAVLDGASALFITPSFSDTYMNALMQLFPGEIPANCRSSWIGFISSIYRRNPIYEPIPPIEALVSCFINQLSIYKSRQQEEEEVTKDYQWFIIKILDTLTTAFNSRAPESFPPNKLSLLGILKHLTDLPVLPSSAIVHHIEAGDVSIRQQANIAMGAILGSCQGVCQELFEYCWEMSKGSSNEDILNASMMTMTHICRNGMNNKPEVTELAIQCLHNKMTFEAACKLLKAQALEIFSSAKVTVITDKIHGMLNHEMPPYHISAGLAVAVSIAEQVPQKLTQLLSECITKVFQSIFLGYLSPKRFFVLVESSTSEQLREHEAAIKQYATTLSRSILPETFAKFLQGITRIPTTSVGLRTFLLREHLIPLLHKQDHLDSDAYINIIESIGNCLRETSGAPAEQADELITFNTFAKMIQRVQTTRGWSQMTQSEFAAVYVGMLPFFSLLKRHAPSSHEYNTVNAVLSDTWERLATFNQFEEFFGELALRIPKEKLLEYLLPALQASHQVRIKQGHTARQMVMLARLAIVVPHELAYRIKFFLTVGSFANLILSDRYSLQYVQTHRLDYIHGVMSMIQHTLPPLHCIPNYPQDDTSTTFYAIKMQPDRDDHEDSNDQSPSPTRAAKRLRMSTEPQQQVKKVSLRDILQYLAYAALIFAVLVPTSLPPEMQFNVAKVLEILKTKVPQGEIWKHENIVDFSKVLPRFTATAFTDVTMSFAK